MKIRRFNESDQIDISPDRVNEIIEELKEIAVIFDNKSVYMDSLLSELSNYKNQSKKGNDQIDDSISALQVIKKDIDDCKDKIDTTVNNLINYNEGGRKFLYQDDEKNTF